LAQRASVTGCEIISVINRGGTITGLDQGRRGALQHQFPLAAANAFVAPQAQEQRAEALARAAPSLRKAATITVEVASAARLARIQADWDDLLRRCESPNAFMHPDLVRLASEAYPERSIRALLAWHEEDLRLVGVWAFALRRPQSAFVPVLAAPAMEHGYLATPVVDRAYSDETLSALLDHIAADADLPKIVALDPIGADATMDALARVLAARGSPSRIMARAMRPRLASALDGKQYLANALSSGSRKKLRQHRRRLAERGHLAFTIVTAATELGDAFEAFLQLEASGWKGRQGTALLANAADAAFTRAMIAALASKGNAAIHALMLDCRPVSMQVVLRAGTGAFTWKTAYDEAFQDASPGMLLLEDYTAAFLADAGIAFVDSCSYDDSGFMAAWSERQEIVHLWFDARRGGSMTFAAASRLHDGALALRAAVKALYLSYRSKWRRRQRAMQTAAKPAA
jgi:CelD/BcsL family acetyltransferase involved in cellulose biosynthesis